MKKSEIIGSIIDTIVLTGTIATENKRPLLEWLFEQYRNQKWFEEPTENTKQQEDNSNA